jgi:hypothetical protein
MSGYSSSPDEYGHIWGLGWEDSDKPHPGFGGSTNIYGGYVGQCEKCGMYSYEFIGGTLNPGKFELQKCGDKIR